MEFAWLCSSIVGVPYPVLVHLKNCITWSQIQVQIKTLDETKIAAGYAPFISMGFVSLVGSDHEVPVTEL